MVAYPMGLAICRPEYLERQQSTRNNTICRYPTYVFSPSFSLLFSKSYKVAWQRSPLNSHLNAIESPSPTDLLDHPLIVDYAYQPSLNGNRSTVRSIRRGHSFGITDCYSQNATTQSADPYLTNA
jgi:hypothetical protein